jgi:hypothetical protein
MRSFNENDYQLVKRYEKDFTKAIESRYCTGLLQEELEVCQKIYNETLNRQANLSCGGCVLQMMTSVGRLYFSYKENRVEPEPQNTAVMNMMTIVEVPKPEPEPIVEDTGSEPVEELMTDPLIPEEPEKPKRQRKSRVKKDEDKVDNQAGEDNPAAL